MKEKSKKWIYCKSYFDQNYTPSEVEMLFRKHVEDAAVGDIYGLVFENDPRAQKQLTRLFANWHELTPDDPNIRKFEADYESRFNPQQ